MSPLTKKTVVNFGLLGVGGYIAPRHLRAIKETGCNLLAACDKNDSVGILDSYFDNVRFFTEIERFDRHIDKLRRKGAPEERLHYMSICTPNYLHDAHIRFALRSETHAICEKPLVIMPRNLELIQELEAESKCNVYTILQLRLLPAVIELKKKIESDNQRNRHCELTYITKRGPWYQVSWKGNSEKSGGIILNIGVHFFDLLIYLFGDVVEYELHLHENDRAAGFLQLEKASITWFLSTDHRDLPEEVIKNGKSSFRTLSLDGKEIELSDGFLDAHTKSYEKIFQGEGFTIKDAAPSIAAVHNMRMSIPGGRKERFHPKLRR